VVVALVVVIVALVVGVGSHRLKVVARLLLEVVVVGRGVVEIATLAIVVVILPLEVVAVVAIVHLLHVAIHVRPRVLIIRIPAAHINIILSLPVHTRNERDSEHL